MKIFKQTETWFILLGGNGALAVHSLSEGRWVSAGISAAASLACVAVLDRIEKRSRAASNQAQ